MISNQRIGHDGLLVGCGELPLAPRDIGREFSKHRVASLRAKAPSLFMKEKNMDYEQKYKEILEWARKNKARLNGVPIEEVLPELAESEDERMVKAIVHVLYENYTDAAVIKGVEIAEIVTWLEKQKEQPTDAKLERVIRASRRVLNNWLDGTDCPDVSGDFSELEYAIREYDGEEKQKEQKLAEVDLKKEIKEWTDLMVGASFPEQDGDFISEEDYRSVIRQTALHFYEQSEKDHELTIKDLELLHIFLYAVKNNKQGVFTFTRLSDEQYNEVLRRFKEAKK